MEHDYTVWWAEIEIYLVELHCHRTVHQLTPGFCGAQVRYISIYKLSIYKPNTHILPKVLMPIAIASVTIPPLSSLPISTPKLYFNSQIPLGGVVSSPDLFSYLCLVLDTYFPRDFILLTFVQLIISRSLLSAILFPFSPFLWIFLQVCLLSLICYFTLIFSF
jgi:hypothetical protein